MRRALLHVRIGLRPAVLMGVLASGTTASLCAHRMDEVMLQPRKMIVPLDEAVVLAKKTEEPVTMADLIAPEWIHWIAAILGTVADAVCGLLIPRALVKIVAGMQTEQGVEPEEFLVLASLLLGKALFHFISTIEVRKACENFACRLKTCLFESLLKRDISFFDTESIHETMSVITGDVRELKMTLGKVVQLGLQSATTLVGGIYMLYSTSAKLTLLLCATVPLWMGAGSLISGFLRKELSGVREADAVTQGHAGEVLSHIRTVRSFGTEQMELARYCESVENVRNDYNRINFLLGGFLALATVTFSGFTAATLLAGSRWDTSLNSSELVSFLMTATRVQGSFSSLSQIVGDAQRVSSNSERVLDYLNNRPLIPLSGGRSLRNVFGRVTFDNVSFAYPSRKDHLVFDHLNLEINPGESVALVGRSGAGKSSLTLLLMRFYDVLFGSVKLDGVDVRELDPAFLRSVVGVVEQRPLLFRGTVFDNIRYGSDWASEKDVLEAARLANCDFIEHLRK